MHNKFPLLFIAVLFSFSLCAQIDSAKAISHFRYFNILASGGLLGEKGDGVMISAFSAHGVRYGRLTASLSIGYDAYEEWRAVPFAANLGLDLGRHTTRGLFIQFCSGYTLARFVSLNDFQSFQYGTGRGLMIHPILGYRLALERAGLYFMLGYKHQRLQYEGHQAWNPNTISVKRQIERFTVHIGFGIN